MICSDVSSLPEIVQDERNGWLLPVTERPSEEIAADIAEHITRLMDDRGLYDRMCAESLAVVREKFDLRVRNARLTELYDRALR